MEVKQNLPEIVKTKNGWEVQTVGSGNRNFKTYEEAFQYSLQLRGF